MKDVAKLDVRDAPDGAAIAVKVVPGASRDRVVGVLGDALKITTAAAAEKGQANAAVAACLARVLGVDKRRVQLVTGQTSARKEFRIAGFSAAELREALR